MGYILISIGIIIYSLRDYIDLQTYGRLHPVINLLYFLMVMFLTVVSIIEIVKMLNNKGNKRLPLIIFIGIFILFTGLIIIRPYNPKLFTNYEQIWVWKGGAQGENETIFKVFNAYGRLKLSNNGRFILNWRSVLNSSNHYGNWTTNKDTLVLSYYGAAHKRVGTKLIYYNGELGSWNGQSNFAAQVVFIKE